MSPWTLFVPRERAQDVRADRGAGRHLRHAVSQLEGAEQIGIAPGRALGEIAELLESIGEQATRRAVVRLGENEMRENLRDEAVFALVEIRLRSFQDCRARRSRVLCAKATRSRP